MVKCIYNKPPKVYVIKLDGSGGDNIFTDELEETQLNTKRACKNWCKHRGVRRRSKGKYRHYKY